MGGQVDTVEKKLARLARRSHGVVTRTAHLLGLLKGAPPAPEVTAPKARRVKA